MSDKMNETVKFEATKETPTEPREILISVFNSLEEKGYISYQSNYRVHLIR